MKDIEKRKEKTKKMFDTLKENGIAYHHVGKLSGVVGNQMYLYSTGRRVVSPTRFKLLRDRIKIIVDNLNKFLKETK